MQDLLRSVNGDVAFLIAEKGEVSRYVLVFLLQEADIVIDSYGITVKRFRQLHTSLRLLIILCLCVLVVWNGQTYLSGLEHI